MKILALRRAERARLASQHRAFESTQYLQVRASTGSRDWPWVAPGCASSRCLPADGAWRCRLPAVGAPAAWTGPLAIPRLSARSARRTSRNLSRMLASLKPASRGSERRAPRGRRPQVQGRRGIPACGGAGPDPTCPFFRPLRRSTVPLGRIDASASRRESQSGISGLRVSGTQSLRDSVSV